MKLYITVKRGILIQEILGVFDDLDIANKHLDTCSKQEDDNYHNFYVLNYPLNKEYLKEPNLDEVLISTSKSLLSLLPSRITKK